MGAVAVVAGLLTLLAQGYVVAYLFRLAVAARRAADRGAAGTRPGLLFTAGSLYAVSTLARVVRYLTDSLGPVGETVVTLGAEIATASLLVAFLRSRHAGEHGAPAKGSGLTGLLLVGTAVLSVLALTGSGFGWTAHLLVSCALGVWAWAYSEAAAASNRAGAARWMGALASVAALVLGATPYLRALVANSASLDFRLFPYTRLVVSAAFAFALLLAIPALGKLHAIVGSRAHAPDRARRERPAAREAPAEPPGPL